MLPPPKWADRFLEWYCNPELLEEIQGDAHELFYKRSSKEGIQTSRLKFIWDVVRFFRWSNIRRSKPKYSSNTLSMFKSYLRIGFRNALRNGITSSINILGLSLGIGTAITIFLFFDFWYHRDNFHTHRDEIYQVTNLIQSEDQLEDWGDSPYMLAPALKEEFSFIENAVRIEYGSGDVRKDETVFNESIWFVDKEFLSMFDFPLLEGDARALYDNSKITLTKETATKYFGNENPIGKPLSVKFNNGIIEEFTVGAVIERPDASSMYFFILLPIEKFENLRFNDVYDWSYLTDATFIQLAPGHTPEEIEGSMEKYKTIQNEASPEWAIEQFQFHSLNGLSRKSYEIISAVAAAGGHPAGMIALGVISLMLLLLACFNYMNISVATISTRLKEIGIRKVVGSQKKEIVQQFLIENLLLVFIALAVGTALAYFLLVPGLNNLFPINLPFVFSSVGVMIAFFGGLLIFIAVVSGAYPAIYVASFQPVQILKGKEKFGQKSLFSRILLTIQFVLAFVNIVGSFVFIDNSIYLNNKDWGYDHDQNYVIPLTNKEEYLALRDQFSNDPEVISLAGSQNHIGFQNNRTFLEYKENRFEVIDFKIGFNYLETMNMNLLDGRWFDESIQSDHDLSIIINESFATKMGWQKPLGEMIKIDSVNKTVIGVVKDFHYNGFYSPISPVMFSICMDTDIRFLTMKLEAGSINTKEKSIKASWREIAPDSPFEGIFQNKVFEGFYNDNNSNVKLLGFIATVAVILACLGLFGLVSFNITRRMREFSVRKVFGANTNQIFKLMNRDYVWILSIAFLIGAPAGFFLMNMLIGQIYPDPQQAGPLPFAIAIGLMLMAVGITVGSQMRRVIRENPSTTLRSE